MSSQNQESATLTASLNRSPHRRMRRSITPRLEFVRFVPLERGLHATMVVSFITLALTGMTLKFSYTPWARVLSRLLGGFQTAGYIHRFAAVVMFCLFVTHLVSLRNLKNRKYGGSWLAHASSGPNTMVPMAEGWPGIRPDHEVVSRKRSASAIRALDLLGEIRLLRGVLGHLHHRLHRSYAVVPGHVHPDFAGMVHQSGNHHSQRRSSAGDRLYLYRALLQHPPAAGEVPHGCCCVHRPDAAGGVETRQTAGV